MKHKVGDKVLIKGEVINHSQFGECRVSLSGCTENDNVYMWFNDDAIIDNAVIEDNTDDIKVGDIVKYETSDLPAVVIYISDSGIASVMYDDGFVSQTAYVDDYKKTGKHIDVESFLKQISE